MRNIATTGKTCIQFTDDLGNKYALKAVNGSNVTQFEVSQKKLKSTLY